MDNSKQEKPTHRVRQFGYDLRDKITDICKLITVDFCIMERYLQGKTQGLSLSLEEYKRDIDNMGKLINECRVVVMDKYHKGYDRMTAYFDKMLNVFEIAKITCECVVSDLQKQKEQEYYYRVWYRRLQAENAHLKYHVQIVIDEMKAECQIQLDRVKQEVTSTEELLRKEQNVSSKLRAQMHYERHMFGNDYVVEAHERVRLFEKSNSDLMTELEKYKNKEAEINAWIDNVVESRHQLEKENDREKAVIRALQLENQELREANSNDDDDHKTIKALQVEIEELRSSTDKNREDGDDIQREKQMETLKYELTRTKQELKDTKDRYVSIMFKLCNSLRTWYTVRHSRVRTALIYLTYVQKYQSLFCTHLKRLFEMQEIHFF